MRPITLMGSFVILACASAVWAQNPTGTAAIENVTVIDVQTGARVANQTVRIEGNTIAAVGAAATVSVPAGARRIDGRGKFLIPGLWQMHGHDLEHYGIDYGSRMAPFQLFIAHGVTGTRDMGSTIDQLFVGKQRIRELKVPAPRIVGAGPLIEGPQTPNPRMAPMVIGLATPGEARQVVGALALAGVDLIKVHGDMTPDTYFALAEEAKRKNIQFAGHIPRGVSLAEASDAGQWSIEHLGYVSAECVTKNAAGDAEIDVPKCQAAFAKLKANGTYLGPTLIGSMPLTADHPNVSDERWKYVKARKRATFPSNFPKDVTPAAKANFELNQRLTRMAAEAGVRLIVSTDAAGGTRLPGFSVLDELILFADAGVTPLATLQAGTLNPMMLLKKDSSLGTITAGKLADMVLLDGDPLTDMRNLRRISAVVADGRVFDAAARQALFDAALKDAQDPN